MESAQAVVVPTQGELLGKLWSKDSEQSGGPEADHGPPLPLFTNSYSSILSHRLNDPIPSDSIPCIEDWATPHPRFTGWLKDKREKKRPDPDSEDGEIYHLDHSWSLHSEQRKVARAKDIGRHFIEEHDHFTTVMLTYCAKRKESESIEEHAARLSRSELSRPRWTALNRSIETEETAGVSVLAPSPPSDEHHRLASHIHEIHWIEGEHSAEPFEAMRDAYLNAVEGGDCVITVRHHESTEIDASPRVRRSDLDEERGPTTSASGEVAANLAILRARNSLRERNASPEEWKLADASDCPDWIEGWAASIARAGRDGSITSAGLSRWTTYGEWKDIADSAKEERGYGSAEEQGSTSEERRPPQAVFTDSEESQFPSDETRITSEESEADASGPTSIEDNSRFDLSPDPSAESRFDLGVG